MNIDICKKCDSDCALFFLSDGTIIMECDVSLYALESKLYFDSSDTVLKHQNGKWIRVKHHGATSCLVCNNSSLKDIEAIEDCTYYADHLLIDWNKS